MARVNKHPGELPRAELDGRGISADQLTLSLAGADRACCCTATTIVTCR